MRLLVVAALCVGCTATGLNHSVAASLNHSFECCVLWETISQYIQTHSGIDRSACEPLECIRTGQVEIFVRQTNAVLAAKMYFEGSTLVVPVPGAVEMQRILVWAFMGRHFTSTLQEHVQGDYFFEFNIASRTMALRKIQCEFERPVYVSMIVITIVVLIFIMASRLLRTAVETLPVAVEVPTAPKATSGVTTPITMRYRSVSQLVV